jgi:hypothetical protein
MEKKMKRDSREIELVKEIKEIESEVGRLEGERQKLADRINDLKKRKYKKDALLKKVVGESLLSGLEEVNVKDLSPQDRVELAKFIAEQIRMRTKDAGSGKGPDDQNSSERVDVSPDIGPESVSKGGNKGGDNGAVRKAAGELKDPLILYFTMLCKLFGMGQART